MPCPYKPSGKMLSMVHAELGCRRELNGGDRYSTSHLIVKEVKFLAKLGVLVERAEKEEWSMGHVLIMLRAVQPEDEDMRVFLIQRKFSVPERL
jgi:hypothetical protein